MLRTWTSTPVASISAMRVKTSKQFGSTVLKNLSPAYMSTLFPLQLGLNCSQGEEAPGVLYLERSGSVGGMICVCISMRKSEDPSALESRKSFSGLGVRRPQLQHSIFDGDMMGWFRDWHCMI